MERYAHFDYAKLTCEIKRLGKIYPNLEIGTIGKSEPGREIYYIKLGDGKRKVFYNGAHHGTEWITAAVLMKFIEEYMGAYYSDSLFYGSDIRKLFADVSIYIVPMVNPDGVDIALNRGIYWQSNANGVDLNHNYNALWQEGKSAEIENGVFGPGPTRYSGECYESEAETRAIVKFTRDTGFDLAIALHSQGEVIYWTFDNIMPPNHLEIAKKLEKASGYALDETEGIASYSGFKDWFMKEFNRSGFTFEVGLGENPLPISQLTEICSRTFPALLAAAESV